MAVEKYSGSTLKSLPEYGIWKQMRYRCSRPNHAKFKDYGGRGISVCAEWVADFGAFLAYVGHRPTEGHSLDRYPNNDGNYEPGNVRWATATEQANNRRQPSREIRGRAIKTLPESGFRGVYASHGGWKAKFEKKYLGLFKDKADAATAYNFAAFERFGCLAAFNIPSQSSNC